MLTSAARVVANLPEEVHWLCDTIDQDSAGRIIVCEDTVKDRQTATMHAIMLLSFTDQDVNTEWLKRKIEEQLARCPNCVREFYLSKKKFYQRLLPYVLQLRSLFVLG